MPTPTEIIHPELTYCKHNEDHCLCPKCKGQENCYHNCLNCESARRILAHLKSPRTKTKNEKMEQYFQIRIDSVTKCDIKERL